MKNLCLRLRGAAAAEAEKKASAEKKVQEVASVLCPLSTEAEAEAEAADNAAEAEAEAEEKAEEKAVKAEKTDAAEEKAEEKAEEAAAPAGMAELVSQGSQGDEAMVSLIGALYKRPPP